MLSCPRTHALALAAGLAVCSSPVVFAQDTINRVGRWSNTATDGDTGSLGDAITLTWSFRGEGEAVGGGRTNKLISTLDDRYGVTAGGSDLTTRPWFNNFRRGFERWGEVTGLSYVYEAADSGGWGAAGQVGVRGDLRVAGTDQDGPFGTLGFNQFPDGGDMTLDTLETSAFTNPRILRNLVTHENGHGIGLAHTVGVDFIMNPSIPFNFEGPQYHDILAAQRNYGDPLEKNGGNDTAFTATGLGSLGFGQTAGRGFDAPDQGDSPTGIAPTTTDFVSIDDASDSDFFRFSTPGSATVTLRADPRGPTYDIAPQGGNPVPYNANNRADLFLDVFAADGTTRLMRLDGTAAGGNERVAAFKLPGGGEYYARVGSKNNQAQMYSFDVAVGQSNAIGDPNLIFVDDFTQPLPTPNGPNSYRQGGNRQGDGLVDSPYETNANGGTRLADVEGDRLRLVSTGDGSNAQNVTVDLLRNFAPQLDGERWAYRFDAELVADVGLGDAWLGFNFADSFPAGSPLASSAELTMLVRPSGATQARSEGGGLSLGSVTGDTANTRGVFELIVDERGPEATFDLLINGTTRVNDEAIDLGDGRYFTFTNHVGPRVDGLSLTSFLDNFRIETLAGPLGDLNLDGSLDAADVDAFVLGLEDAAAFQAAFNFSGIVQGDVNNDGLFNLDDISPFAGLIGGDTLAVLSRRFNVPEPATGLLLVAAGLLAGRRRRR